MITIKQGTIKQNARIKNVSLYNKIKDIDFIIIIIIIIIAVVIVISTLFSVN